MRTACSGGRLLIVAAGALAWGSGPAFAQAGPAPTTASDVRPATKETGFTQSALEAAFKKAITGIAFGQPTTGDGFRRVFGTIDKAKLPAIELMGLPEDLSTITALSPLKPPQGPATVEDSSFAAALLDITAPDWPQRKDWLRAALKKVEDSNADYQVAEKRGQLQVTFAAWQRMGMFKVTVETVEGAAARLAYYSKAGIPDTGNRPSVKADSPTAAAPVPAPKSTPTTKEAGAAAKTETKADGSIVVDGKYTLKGKGTEAEPYKVTWDQLVSAQDEYVPKDGRKEIPARITMLDGKWLEITGYVAFPLMVETPDECLSMMNQWDGCCIGVPPTPYDAIEVHLTKAVEGNARMTTYGNVRGKFKVDPHLVGGWLVGLYAMDHATLTPQTYGGFAP